MCRHADVVELADALASGASGGNSVRVQVPPSAPDQTSGLAGVFLIQSKKTLAQSFYVW